MADLTDIERLREVMILGDDARGSLTEAIAAQNQRWQLLRDLVDNAGDQYISMRQDMVEERFIDQGSPLWLSCLIAVGVTILPVTAISTGLLSSVTHTTQKLLRNADRRGHSSASKVIRRELDPKRLSAAQAEHEKRSMRLAMRTTDKMVAKFAKRLDPELSNSMQNFALWVGETTLKQQPAQPTKGRKQAQTPDAPLAAIKEGLKASIRATNRAEATADAIIRERLTALAAIAVSSTPEKEAKAREAKARERQPVRMPRVPFLPSAEELPKTNKDALLELTQQRDELALTLAGKQRIPHPQDLRDLQLLIESMIWASTYDFTPQYLMQTPRVAKGDPETARHSFMKERSQAPLPEGLWTRLIERYRDPDEQKSYKDVGMIKRLGTRDKPVAATTIKGTSWWPEVRLSHYFSQELYPKVRDESYEWIRQVR